MGGGKGGCVEGRRGEGSGEMGVEGMICWGPGIVFVGHERYNCYTWVYCSYH